MTTHLFPNKPVLNAVGQTLVVDVDTPVTFTDAEFFANLSRAGATGGNWDFGDGTRAPSVAGVATHTFASPGNYSVQFQANVDGRLLTCKWLVKVVIKRLLFESNVSVPWTGAVHDTFVAEDGQLRHAIVVLPKLCAVVPGRGVGSWGTPVAWVPPTADQLAAACDEAASRLQSGFAAGLGHMQMPSAKLEQAVYAHFANDGLAVGTNDTVIDYCARLESVWRELERGPNDGHRLPALANVVKEFAGAVTLLSTCKPMGWEASTADFAGTADVSVQGAAVRQWLEYANAESDDNVALAALLVWNLRQLSGQYAKPPPPAYDHSLALAWEAAQQAIQCVYSFYQSLGDPDATEHAAILVLIDPQSRQLSVRLIDNTAKLWACWQVGPSNAAAAPSFADMVLEAGEPHGGFVQARGVAAAGSGDVLWPWDMRRIESLLSAGVRAETPQFSGITAAVTRAVSQTGLAVGRVFQPDGTVRQHATLTNLGWVAADVIRPTVPLDAFAPPRGGMQPHAALNYLIKTTTSTLSPANSGSAWAGSGLLADLATLMR